MPDLLPPKEIGEVRLQRRRELRELVEECGAELRGERAAKLMDANFAAAYRLMTSTTAREAFDLEQGAAEACASATA